MSQHWFKSWLGKEKTVTSHYLNHWYPIFLSLSVLKKFLFPLPSEQCVYISSMLLVVILFATHIVSNQKHWGWFISSDKLA